jgi:hypothetical protein
MKLPFDLAPAFAQDRHVVGLVDGLSTGPGTLSSIITRG